MLFRFFVICLGLLFKVCLKLILKLFGVYLGLVPSCVFGLKSFSPTA